MKQFAWNWDWGIFEKRVTKALEKQNTRCVGCTKRYRSVGGGGSRKRKLSDRGGNSSSKSGRRRNAPGFCVKG